MVVHHVLSLFSAAVDDFSEPPERPTSLPQQFHSSGSIHGHKSSPKLGGFMRRMHSSGHGHSDTTVVDPADKKPTKVQRMTSEPSFSAFEHASKDKEKKSGKRISLLKKKKHASNQAPLAEDTLEAPSDSQPSPRSPLLMPNDTTNSEIEGTSEGVSRSQASVSHSNGAGVGMGGALGGVAKRLSRPVSSPRMSRLSDSPTKSPPKAAFIQSLPTPPAAAPPAVLSASVPSSAPSAAGGGGSSRKPKRPPPPPPPYARTHGRTGMKVLLITSKNDSESDDGEGARESISPASKRDENSSPPLSMQVPTTPTIKEEVEEDVKKQFSVHDEGEGEKVEEGEVFESVSPKKASQSMEDLFKDLEEFDELNSLSLPNGLHSHDKGERDFATIPRSELPPHHDSDEDKEGEKLTIRSPETPEISITNEKGASLTPSPEEDQASFSAPAKPPRMRKKPQWPPQPQAVGGAENHTGGEKPTSPLPSKPQVTGKPKPPPVKPQSVPSSKPAPPASKPHPPSTALKPQPPVTKPAASQNGLKEEPLRESSTSPHPKAPPRRRRSQKLAERMAMYEKKDEKSVSPSVSPQPGKVSPAPPAKPKVLKKTHLESLERPVCSSAPVSRTASPDCRHGIATSGRDASTSNENLGSSLNPNRSPVVMRRAGDVGPTRDPSFSDEELVDCTVRPLPPFLPPSLSYCQVQ